MKLKNDQGSIMLEATLILPLYVLFIFFLIQITFVWTAQQMTYYAAYCGARAAMVYHPEEYGAEKQKDGSWKTKGAIKNGVVHYAACTVLSWISWSLNGYDISDGRGAFYLGGGASELMNFHIGTYSIPLSSNVSNQVWVQVREYEKIMPKDQKNSRPAGNDDDSEPAKIYEQFPAVTVDVYFKCPLFIPLGGPLIAYFFAADDDVCIPTDDAIGLIGFQAGHGDMVQRNLEAHGNYSGDNAAFTHYSIVLKESCTMAKPYKTDTFPRVPKGDKFLMGQIN